MMGESSQNDLLLDDDYVAGLLAREAGDCSIKYSAMGLEGFRDSKKPASLPKPNTRFLRHIIKDTDTHNKALLAKEAAESKARLQDLNHTEEVKRLKTNPDSRDIRKRQLGDIQAILGKKRSRDGTAADQKPRKQKRVRSPPGHGTPDSKRDSRSKRQRDLIVHDRKSRKEHGRLQYEGSDASEDESRTRKRHRRSERDGRRDRSSERQRHRAGHSSRGDGAEDSNRKRRRRSRSPRRSPPDRARERSTTADDAKGTRHRDRSSHRHKDKEVVVASNSDSDPLDEMIGPEPAPKYRGRGRLAGSAGIDRRFSESYDPQQDVVEDGEPGGTGAGGLMDPSQGWDHAVEIFRDRQKLKQAQAERLKAAGFAFEQIPQTASGGQQTSLEGVRWAKAGDEREWDKGKADG